MNYRWFFFTVLTQSAVGAYLLLLLWQARQPVGSDRCASIKLLGVVALFALGGVMGSVHLGQPLRALNMLAGVGRSPMSNEIVLSGIFIACAGLGALLALALLLAARQEPKWLPALVAVAVIAAELLGRIVFYDLWQIGM